MLKIENNKIYIIMYHYVREVKKSIYPNLKALELNNFISQINFFKKKFNVLDYSDFIEILNSKKIPKKPSILLTFDDGYLDHYKNVFPILSKKKISGVFYTPIITFKKNKVLDVNKIHFILEKENNRGKIINFIDVILRRYLKKNLIEMNLKKLNLFNRWDDEETTLIKRLLQDHLPEKVRLKILNKLFENVMDESEIEFSKKLYMSQKDMCEMSRNGMYFGIHGCNHKRLSRLNYNDQKFEINDSIKVFKKLRLNENSLSICYPYGSYNHNTLKISKKNKLNFGLTINVNPLFKKNISKVYEIPRFDCNDFLKFI